MFFKNKNPIFFGFILGVAFLPKGVFMVTALASIYLLWIWVASGKDNARMELPGAFIFLLTLWITFIITNWQITITVLKDLRNVL